MSDTRKKIELLNESQGYENLCYYIEEAKKGDGVDFYEGLDAYFKYNLMMRRISDKYGWALHKVTAVFCATSPNNDYVGNIRSVISILEGIRDGVPGDDIVISTYNHCKYRAMDYLFDKQQFASKDRGMKILNFYYSILYPNHPDFCTIDGHMVAAYNGDSDMKMVDATISKGEYRKIKEVTEAVAGDFRVLPSQAQAIIWFARKRLHKIKYSPVVDLFGAEGDKWGIMLDLDVLKRFARVSEGGGAGR